MKAKVGIVNGVKKVLVEHKKNVFIIQGTDAEYWEVIVNSCIEDFKKESQKELLKVLIDIENTISLGTKINKDGGYHWEIKQAIKEATL